MKILIIDDERSTRESIKLLAGFEEDGKNEIYEARNGAEGYQLMEKVCPDLVFMDMNMPVMDGADLLELMDEKRLFPKVIVVSGYTDFRYTKAAILKRFVVDYIQKPIDEKQLKKAVEKAGGYEALKEERPETAKVDSGQAGIMVGIFIENFPELLKSNYNGSPELFKYFLMCQLQHYFDDVNLYEPPSEMYQYGIFFTLPEGRARGLEEGLRRTLAQMENRYGIRGWAVWEDCPGESGGRAYTRIWETANHERFCDEKRVFCGGEQGGRRQIAFEAAVWAGELSGAAAKGNGHLYEITAKRLLKTLEGLEIGSIYQRKVIFSGLIYEIGRRFSEKGISLQPLVARRMEELYAGKLLFTEKFGLQWLGRFLEEVWEWAKGKEEKVPAPIQEIFYYIQENYQKKISLSEVAETFSFNTSTVSRMFVRYLGVNYIDYVNDLRLEKAKELLANTEFNVSAIAEQAGFESLSYFSRLFKKKCGVSPQEFRKKLE